MYCGTCGYICIIPKGYEGNAMGVITAVITNKKTNAGKVIRCVECVNKYGMDKNIHVCVRAKVEVKDNPRELPTVTLDDGKTYFMDDKLQQLRNVENPHDFIEI